MNPSLDAAETAALMNFSSAFIPLNLLLISREIGSRQSLTWANRKAATLSEDKSRGISEYFILAIIIESNRNGRLFFDVPPTANQSCSIATLQQWIKLLINQINFEYLTDYDIKWFRTEHFEASKFPAFSFPTTFLLIYLRFSFFQVVWHEGELPLSQLIRAETGRILIVSHQSSIFCLIRYKKKQKTLTTKKGKNQ